MKPVEITLRGELVSFTRRTLDGWGTGELRVDGVSDVTGITGKMLDAKPGDTVEVVGRYVEHERFGIQFRVSSCITQQATSTEGAVLWLASAMPGIGPKRAQELIARCGGVPELWHMLEHEHERLAELDGITVDRAQAIHVTYMAQRNVRDHMVALRGWGLTDNQIQKCMDEWHTLEATVLNIRANPFLLARHVHGFGFARADEVARRAGMARNAPERIEAGIVHTLDEATASGHCWLWGGALQKIAATKYLHVTLEECADGIMRAWRSGFVVRRGKRVYSARMESIEETCSVAIMRIVSGETESEIDGGRNDDEQHTYH